MLIPGASNRAMSTTIAGDMNRSGSNNLPNNSMLIPGPSNRVMSAPITGDMNRSGSNNDSSNSSMSKNRSSVSGNFRSGDRIQVKFGKDYT